MVTFYISNVITGISIQYFALQANIFFKNRIVNVHIFTLNIFLKTEKNKTKILFCLFDSQLSDHFFGSSEGIDDTNKHNVFEVISCTVISCRYWKGLAPKLSPRKSLKLLLKSHLSWKFDICFFFVLEKR